MTIHLRFLFDRASGRTVIVILLQPSKRKKGKDKREYLLASKRSMILEGVPTPKPILSSKSIRQSSPRLGKRYTPCAFDVGNCILYFNVFSEEFCYGRVFCLENFQLPTGEISWVCGIGARACLQMSAARRPAAVMTS